ncbi:MAG: hypothetical protein CML13_06750 [Puniceicoccaceae bacterium]|nr:hypothetical protein [Puniceicoccaceae bacterium]|tara:strand:- start:6092 stop:6430 length:339 start_codon:yes stop_codon:yes gene_type:complete
MNVRHWVGSEMTETIDARQQQMLNLVLAKVRLYYDELYQTKASCQYPLSLSRLMRLCNRNGTRTLMAVRILSLSYDPETEQEPPLYYDRAQSPKNPMRRAYRIYLRSPHRDK